MGSLMLLTYPYTGSTNTISLSNRHEYTSHDFLIKHSKNLKNQDFVLSVLPYSITVYNKKQKIFLASCLFHVINFARNQRQTVLKVSSVPDGHVGQDQPGKQ